MNRPHFLPFYFFFFSVRNMFPSEAVEIQKCSESLGMFNDPSAWRMMWRLEFSPAKIPYGIHVSTSDLSDSESLQQTSEKYPQTTASTSGRPLVLPIAPAPEGIPSNPRQLFMNL